MSKCVVCGDPTDVIVNINFKATNVCDPCCVLITKQTVQTLEVERLRDKESGKESTGIIGRKGGW